MSKHAEADLILKLYDLRREETMRKARDWYFREFHPQSVSDIKDAMFSQHSGYLRMVMSYWDMAAALVNHGAISLDLFSDTNGEHMSVFAKMEPFVAEIRTEFGPHFMKNLEKVVDETPNGRQRCAEIREWAKTIPAEMAKRQAKSAKQS